jgi:hypothetical protein
MTTNIYISNSGSGAYIIDGVNNGNISLIRGNTYNLVINATGHPFWIQAVSGSYSSNNIYTSGVTNNGTQNGTITFIVPNDAPNTLYYACQFHSSMQGNIIITNAAPPVSTLYYTIGKQNFIGDISFQNVSNINSSNTLNLSGGTVNITGSNLQNTTNIIGNATINGIINMNANTNFSGSATTINGNTTMNGLLLNISGNTISTNDTTQINAKTLIGLSGGIIDICGSNAVNICGGIVYITGGPTSLLGGTTSIQGNSSFIGNTSINGLLNISGNTVLTNDITQINSKTLIGLSGGIIDICGSNTINIYGGGVNITGNTTMTGNNTTTTGNLVVSGAVSFANVPSINNMSTNIQSNQLYIDSNGLITKGAVPVVVLKKPKKNTINQQVYGTTLKKNSYNYSKTETTFIKSSQIAAYIDSDISSNQTYTFGPSIPNRWVGVGRGTNTIVYSNDGINWIGLGNSIFYIANDVKWNGSMWVAVGDYSYPNNPYLIAYSYDGIKWTGIENDATSLDGIQYEYMKGIEWNGKMWVAVGSGGTNNIAYSYDGLKWKGVTGTTIFSSVGNKVAWNGKMWVAVGAGYGLNSIAYSYDGITWYPVPNSSSIFSSNGNNIAWNGNMWVAVGFGTNTIAYSYNGIAWTGLGNIFDGNGGFNVKWNGKIWVAIGSGTNTIAYSYNGINWTGITGTTIFTLGNGLEWNGNMWVAVGAVNNKLAYSYDGINWIGLGLISNIFVNQGQDFLYSVAFNGRRPHTITFPRNLTVAVGYGTNTIAYSYDGMNWTGLGSSIFTEGFAVATNGKMWVAGGYEVNPIAYSYDGMNWTGVGYSVFTTVYGFAWNDSMWIAVGNGANTIAYSYDGITWTGLGTTIFSISGRAVEWNGSMWIAVGDGANTISYSYDGINWTGLGNIIFVDSNGNSGIGLTIAWNGFMWVAGAAGGGYSLTNTLAYSYDGMNWTGLGNTFSSVVISSIVSIAWNGFMWVAVSNVLPQNVYSYNGINWFSYSGYYFNSICWNGSIWIGVGAYGDGTNRILYSKDGKSWTGITANTILNSANGVASNYKINKLGIVDIQHPTIAVGQGTNSFAYSLDGIKWVGVENSIFSSSSNGVAWNGKMWVAVGSGVGGYRIANSYDGITWKNVASTFSSGMGVAWNGKIWVAVGSGSNTIAWSADGITWTGLGNSIFSNWGFGIAWNRKMWVAVGSGTNTIAYSYDGSMNWTPVSNSSTSIFTTVGKAVAWNGIMWVAVGQGSNSIAWSADGISWNGLGNPAFSIGHGVAWNGKRWVAVGQGSNSIAWSDNGTYWTGLGNSTFSIGNGVTWNGKRWIAVGQGTNSIAYSNDGETWYGVPNSTSIFSGTGSGVASNSNVGAVIVDSALTLNANTYPQSNTLDVVSDTYYNIGYTNFSCDITTE